MEQTLILSLSLRRNSSSETRDMATELEELVEFLSSPSPPVSLSLWFHLFLKLCDVTDNFRF